MQNVAAHPSKLHYNLELGKEAPLLKPYRDGTSHMQSNQADHPPRYEGMMWHIAMFYAKVLTPPVKWHVLLIF